MQNKTGRRSMERKKKRRRKRMMDAVLKFSIKCVRGVFKLPFASHLLLTTGGEGGRRIGFSYVERV